MFKLIETTSSALAAASLLAAALGFAVIGKPLRADEPLNGSFCGDCQSDDCPECPGEGDSPRCRNGFQQACGCICVVSAHGSCGGVAGDYYYECLQP
jgi:hypothetical protein